MPRATRRQSARMRYFSTLAGPIQKLPKHRKYTVAFTNLASADHVVYRVWAKLVAYGALAITLGLAILLFLPTHWIALRQPSPPTQLFNWIMLGCLLALQLQLIIGTYSATRATLRAKNPVPVRPPTKLRVAFVTTRAPAESIAMVKTTLEAMARARYSGNVDIWLLDETKDPKLEQLCTELGVFYFSRAGIEAWNTPKPLRYPTLRRIKGWGMSLLRRGQQAQNLGEQPNPFLAAKTKHGNFNAWREHLKQRGYAYDILAGVDTDQVPEPNFLQRLLGYFRDPDVAYVVGPQVYGNYAPGLGGLVARWAESQASFFQSTIQRAGNHSASPMFVGTNYAVRMTTLDQIGGFQPCITEDMATGLAIHTRRNPLTGNRWKSIYTPDVLAIGEGPDMWGPYFTQQWRWAAGTFDTWRRVVWRVFFRLSPKAMLHYFLMLTFYPITALTWLLGITSTLVYLVTGATAILAPWSEFVSLYMMSVVMQFSLYFWNRRFNVSPHEPPGSYGIAGMALTSLTAPIYLSALAGVALGKRAHFVVTPKGRADERNYDMLRTFRTHLGWALVLCAALIYGIARGNDHPAMLIWAGGQLLVCLVPFALGWVAWLPARIRKTSMYNRFIVSGGA